MYIRAPAGEIPGHVYNHVGKIRDLVGKDADRERLVTMDFDRASINAADATFPHATATGRRF